MSKISRAKQVMEGLAGKTLTNAKMLTYVEDFINYDENEPRTNEQKAGFFLDNIKATVKSNIKSHVTARKLSADRQAAEDEGDNAVIDL